MVNSQQLLYINIILGIIFVVYFLVGRSKSQSPTKLNMKANEDFSKSIIKNPNALPTSSAHSAVKAAEPPSPQPIVEVKPQKMTVLEPENVIQLKEYQALAKNLSISFVFNGHEWEAHEVLGVPAGASMPKVTESYQRLVINSDPSTFEFYEFAYQAILKRWRDRL